MLLLLIVVLQRLHHLVAVDDRLVLPVGADEEVDWSVEIRVARLVKPSRPLRELLIRQHALCALSSVHAHVECVWSGGPEDDRQVGGYLPSRQRHESTRYLMRQVILGDEHTVDAARESDRLRNEVLVREFVVVAALKPCATAKLDAHLVLGGEMRPAPPDILLVLGGGEEADLELKDDQAELARLMDRTEGVIPHAPLSEREDTKEETGDEVSDDQTEERRRSGEEIHAACLKSASLLPVRT